MERRHGMIVRFKPLTVGESLESSPLCSIEWRLAPRETTTSRDHSGNKPTLSARPIDVPLSQWTDAPDHAS